MSRVFAIVPRDQGSIPGQVIPKTQKMVLDATLLNTQYYKVWIKGKWSNPRKRVVTPQQLGVVAIEKEASGCPQLWLPTYLCIYQHLCMGRMQHKVNF